ncbi:MAG: (4Fe-4S)-binding protein [Ignavibacteriaceae bacterium]|nr:(4Fe-4S)-binding protein [Ignavibacteriaceae bacterium]
MKDVKKEYSNGELTVVWQSGLCTHSANCVRGLPRVFNTRKSPWVNAEGASTEEIKAQVDKCPSGALSYYMNKK